MPSKSIEQTFSAPLSPSGSLFYGRCNKLLRLCREADEGHGVNLREFAATINQITADCHNPKIDKSLDASKVLVAAYAKAKAHETVWVFPKTGTRFSVVFAKLIILSVGSFTKETIEAVKALAIDAEKMAALDRTPSAPSENETKKPPSRRRQPYRHNKAASAAAPS